MTEMASFLHVSGQNLLDALESIWRRFGLHLSEQSVIELPTQGGTELLEGIMNGLRKNPPSCVGEQSVVVWSDLQHGTRIFSEGSKEELNLPRTNLLIFELEDQSRIMLRPSGTEPKLKIYFDLVELLVQNEPLHEGKKRAHARMAQLKITFKKNAKQSRIGCETQARGPRFRVGSGAY